MKKLLLLLLLLAGFTACRKNKDTVPASPAEAVAGTYVLKSMRYTNTADPSKSYNLTNLPATVSGKTLSGKVSITRTADAAVDLNLTLSVTGSQDSSVPMDGLSVEKSGNGYILYADGMKIGDITNGSLSVDISDSSGGLAFTARK